MTFSLCDAFTLPTKQKLRWASTQFSHQDEAPRQDIIGTAEDYGINVELTATERWHSALLFPKRSRYLPQPEKAMNWDFTNDSHIEVIDSVTIQGYRFSDGWARNQHVYFRTRFSKPFAAVQMDTHRHYERR